MPKLCAAFWFSLSLALGAYADEAKLNEDESLIAQISLSDSTIVIPNSVIYPDGERDWYLALGELASALDIAIEVIPSKKIAKGFILSEDRKFELNLAQGKVFYDEQYRDFSATDVIAQGGDFYVRSQVLARWLPLSIAVNVYRSQVVIIPREKLPFQARKERERAAAMTGSGDGATDFGFPHLKPPHSVLGFPFIDHQETLAFQKSGETSSTAYSHSSQFSGELFEAEAQASLFGDLNTPISGGNLRLARREPGGLGALNLTEVQFFDSTLPAVPLAAGGATARGVAVSSFPITAPTNFQKTDLEGLLQPGWELLLYRNGVLLERKIGDASGRYRFRDLRLQYGNNDFRLEFFGPRGERRVEERKLNISADLVAPGSVYYRFGMGVLPSSASRISGQVATNFFRFFTVNSAFLVDRDPSQYFGYMGISGVNPLFAFQTGCAANHLGGKGCEWAQQFGLGVAQLSTKYTRLFNFKSDLFNPGEVTRPQEEQINAVLSHSIYLNPSIGVEWEAQKDNYAFGQSQFFLRNLLSFGADVLSVNHRLEWNPDIENKFRGAWDFSISPPEFRLAFRAGYTMEEITGVGVETQYTLGSFSTSFRVGHDLTAARTNYALSLSRTFDLLSFGIGAAFTNPQEWGVSTNLGISLVREPVNGGLQFSSQSATQSGSASVTAFRDKDRDGVLDPGEKPIPGITVANVGGGDPIVTDDSGVAFFPRLTPYTPADLSISLKELKDPYLRPGQPGIRLFPRPGKAATVALPMIVVGEIDGNISRKGESAMRVPIELLDEAGNILYRKKSDKEGFYVFEAIPSGDYIVRIAPSYLRQQGEKSLPQEHRVTIPDEGSFESDKDFQLRSP